MEARERHLTELTNMLTRLKVKIEEALPEDKYDAILSIRQDPLFESIMTHCLKVAQTFTTLQIAHIAPHNGDQCWKQQRELELINRLLKEIERALVKKSHADEWCLDCISEKDEG